MPANSEKWSCNKPITDERVRPGTTCTIACLVGHDNIKGMLLKLINSTVHPKTLF